MSGAERAAAIYAALRELGLRSLLMGGHAVRYYGVDRNTLDYDFHLSLDADAWGSLGELLSRSSLLGSPVLAEGPSWRPNDFRRFIIGTLPSGQEERLEFWRRNHLLPPFEELYSRREEGAYGGGQIAFLGLDDLIHSKETEREDDWRDVQLLEEIADDRTLASAHDQDSTARTLAHLRSRRGLESAQAHGLLASRELVGAALAMAQHPISRALLIPYLPQAASAHGVPFDRRVAEILDGALLQVAPGSPRHLALVEAVRRLRKQAAMAADRADKERIAAERS